METASKAQGEGAGILTQTLRGVNRERYDYVKFLQKFAVLGEELKTNDDEFDYIFYTYGLNLYGDVPLIEPLEYKDIKRIREFVIAIDTSGSVSGELVQAFMQKTYNILMQSESFFTKINLRIIQCDAAIQADYKITNRKEFDSYLQTMQFSGFGGTDFRPVFSYVDALTNAGEFLNLKGLIYFTDGYGTYPERKPSYETAFVFIETDDKDLSEPTVPVWAIKLILNAEELEAY
jgi:predicted metal-dependent peptidase